jgi:hypothetical protein
MATKGRPLKIETPEKMTELVDEYLLTCVEEGQPVTLTGALLHLGLFSRTSLIEYEKREGFSEPVKRLKAHIEHSYELRLHGTAPTGAIFALKNMGWEDKSTQELTGAGGKELNLWGNGPK